MSKWELISSNIEYNNSSSNNLTDDDSLHCSEIRSNDSTDDVKNLDYCNSSDDSSEASLDEEDICREALVWDCFKRPKAQQIKQEWMV